MTNDVDLNKVSVDDINPIIEYQNDAMQAPVTNGSREYHSSKTQKENAVEVLDHYSKGLPSLNIKKVEERNSRMKESNNPDVKRATTTRTDSVFSSNYKQMGRQSGPGYSANELAKLRSSLTPMSRQTKPQQNMAIKKRGTQDLLELYNVKVK